MVISFRPQGVKISLFPTMSQEFYFVTLDSLMDMEWKIKLRKNALRNCFHWAARTACTWKENMFCDKLILGKIGMTWKVEALIMIPKLHVFTKCHKNLINLHMPKIVYWLICILWSLRSYSSVKDLRLRFLFSHLAWYHWPYYWSLETWNPCLNEILLSRGTWDKVI